jgi:hypothetical protein
MPPAYGWPLGAESSENSLLVLLTFAEEWRLIEVALDAREARY